MPGVAQTQQVQPNDKPLGYNRVTYTASNCFELRLRTFAWETAKFPDGAPHLDNDILTATVVQGSRRVPPSIDAKKGSHLSLRHSLHSSSMCLGKGTRCAAPSSRMGALLPPKSFSRKATEAYAIPKLQRKAHATTYEPFV